MKSVSFDSAIPAPSPRLDSDRSRAASQDSRTLLGHVFRIVHGFRFVRGFRVSRARLRLSSGLTRLFVQDAQESPPVRLPGSLPRSLLRDLHAFHVINVFRGRSFFRRWRRFRPWSHRQL